MSELLLELNDHTLRLSRPEGLVVSTPGFASIDGDMVLYGDAARARYRLHPRDSFNQFWHQLSLEPLRSQNPHFRHHADMAYGQLAALTSEYAADSELLLALPGHYSREQIAVVLGLLQHCPADPAGLIDQAVLAAAFSQHADTAICLDLQLHQCLLTHLTLEDGHVTRTRVQQIPGAGLLALNEAWVSMITDAFIRQCRFNPQHTADTEQFMHDHLPAWIESALTDNEVNLEINHRGTLYKATVLRSHFEQKSRQAFSRIARELESHDEAQLLVPETAAVLPGINQWLPAFDSIDTEGYTRYAFASLEAIRELSQGNRLLTSLPSAGVAVPAAASIPRNRHLLIGHRTWAIPAGGSVVVGSDLAGDADLPFTLSLDCGEPMRLEDCPAGLLLNGEDASPGQEVKTGDRLTMRDSDIALQFIEVG